MSEGKHKPQLEVLNWGKNQIVPLTALVRECAEIGSIAIHFKENGDINEQPSLLFECKDEKTNVYVHQISLKTLNDALAVCGYQITPIEGEKVGMVDFDLTEG